MGFAHPGRLREEGRGNGFFDQSILEADAHVTGENLHEVLAFIRRHLPEKCFKDCGFGDWPARDDEAIDAGGQIRQIQRTRRGFLAVEQREVGGAAGVGLAGGNLSQASNSNAGGIEQSQPNNGPAGRQVFLLFAGRDSPPAEKPGGHGDFALIVQRSQIGRELLDFRQPSRGDTHGIAGSDKVFELGTRPRFCFIVRYGCFFCRVDFPRFVARPAQSKGEFHLVIRPERPRLDAALAQVARKFRRIPVRGQHQLRSHPLHCRQQIRVVRMIRKRKNFIYLITKSGPRRQRPASAHGQTSRTNSPDHLAARRTRRHQQNPVRQIRPRRQLFIRRENHSLRGISLRHFKNRWMQHPRKPSLRQLHHDLLGLAHRIRHQHRHLAVIETSAAKSNHGIAHFGRARKTKSGQPKRRFHDHGVRLGKPDRLRRARRAALKITRVQ